MLLNTILMRDVEAAGWDQPIPTGPGSALEVAILADLRSVWMLSSLQTNLGTPQPQSLSFEPWLGTGPLHCFVQEASAELFWLRSTILHCEFSSQLRKQS